MGSTKLEYQIVGRYMDGKEVTGYHMQCLSNGRNDRYTKEQVCFLVGKGQVTNCSGQIYKDKVLLRGVGMSLDELPIQREDGSLSRTDSVGKIRRGATAADVMTQLMLTKAIVSGRNVIGYVVTNAGGGTHNASRAQILELAKNGRIGNARYQESNGRPILRGVNINLNELPTVTAEELGITSAKQPKTQSVAGTPNTPSTPSTTAPKTEKKSDLTPNQLTWPKEDQETIRKFKNACKNTFKAMNTKLGNRLKSQGFYGDGGGDRNSCYTFERFDFGVTGRPTSEGGWIELVNSGSLGVTFNVMMPNEDVESWSVSLNESGFKEGWGFILEKFRIAHYI